MEDYSTQNKIIIKSWLIRAKSNLEIARAGKISEEILYEDLCFECQQAVEKSLKALLISVNIVFPKSHSITRLLELIEEAGICIPENVKEAVILTPYSVNIRYPGDYEPVDMEEYKNVLEITENVFYWVKNEIFNH